MLTALLSIAVLIFCVVPGLSETTSVSRANRLIASGSPYLQQHAHNPVDWYPWGEEAFKKAKTENKLIFISIGYSTCYWCHVAERTIYSNASIAALMNKWFVNIKVDREERPDIDEIYMLARQILSGGGGWPNNLFLTPDLKPIFAGSYFPPADMPGRMGFPSLLKRIHQTWQKDPDEITAIGDNMHDALLRIRNNVGGPKKNFEMSPAKWLDKARDEILSRQDTLEGGFDGGGASRFPQSPVLSFLLEDYRLNGKKASLEAVGGALRAMAFGGIHDQLGGGLHRYSTEPSWSVPHFEKMLFDNAQLIDVYSSYYAITRAPFARMMTEDIVEYLKTRMTAPGGGFYTAEDADIDGREGESYLWTRTQITDILGAKDASRFFAIYQLIALPDEPDGPGVLRVRKDLAASDEGQSRLLASLTALAPQRRKLLAHRDKRPQPLRDDKIVVVLNGLAISALLRAGKALNKPEWIAMAKRSGEFLWEKAFEKKTLGSGPRLRRYINKEKAWGEGFLEDYAMLGLGFLELDAAVGGESGDDVWRRRARTLASVITKRFVSPDGVVVTQAGDTSLIVPAMDLQDSTTPSGTSAAYAFLMRLGKTEPQFDRAAGKILTWMAPKIAASPDAWVSFLTSLAKRGPTAVVVGYGAAGDSAFSAIQSAPHVKLRAVGLRRDERDEIEITLKIDPGYHINANPASLDFLVPTRVILPKGVKAKITYPPAREFKTKFVDEGILVYEGTQSIKVDLPRGSLDKKEYSKLELEVQACTVKVCLAPSTVSVPVKLP